MTQAPNSNLLPKSDAEKHARGAADIILKQAMAKVLAHSAWVMVRLEEDGYSIAVIPPGMMMK